MTLTSAAPAPPKNIAHDVEAVTAHTGPTKSPPPTAHEQKVIVNRKDNFPEVETEESAKLKRKPMPWEDLLRFYGENGSLVQRSTLDLT